jgi:hypothetical protein
VWGQAAYAKIIAVSHSAKLMLEFPPSLTSAMPLEVRDILDDHVLWSVVIHDPEKVAEQVAIARTRKSRLPTSFGEWLTREARAKDLVPWDVLCGDQTDVARWAHPKVRFIHVAQDLIQFAGEYAPEPELSQGQVEAPKTSEKISETHSRLPST